MENNNKIRVIFLDIDGVLSTSFTRYCISSEKIKLLENLIKETDAKIVVSSSWAVGCRDANDFIEKNFRGYHKHRSKEVKDNSLFLDSIIDVTDHGGSTRGDEIQRWLDTHEDEVESYAIIDDDSDFLEEQLFNFVQTDCWYGLSERVVHLATQVLKNERIISPIRLNMELMYRWRLKCNGYKSNINKLLKEYYNNHV